MFIVSLTYVCSLDKVDDFLNQHVIYLKEEYNKGNFIASGRKVPRTGGVILSNLEDKEELENIIKEDPFFINNIAEYEIIKFIPSMCAEGFDNLVP